MHVLIAGAGRVGTSIAQYLGEEYAVTLIDTSRQALGEATSQLDVQTILGNAADPVCLQKAGAERADIFIATTKSEETNIVASQIAHSLFGIKLKIARLHGFGELANDWTEKFAKHYLPIDVIISPEEETVREILHHLKAPFAVSVFSFFRNRLYVLGLKISTDSPFLGYPIRHLDKTLGPLNIGLLKVVRGKVGFIPQEHHTLEEKDIVYFLIPTEHMNTFHELAGYKEPSLERVLILGGGHLSFLLASSIEKNYPNLSSIIVEPTPAKAKQLVTHLTNTIVLQGDSLDPQVLSEAGVQLTDSVIAISSDDKANILGALLAKRYGAKNSVVLINRRGYAPLMHSLKLDKILNPSLLAISLILSHIHRDYVRKVHKLGDPPLDAIMEVVMNAGAPGIGLTLKTLNHLKEMWIFAILRGDTVLLGTPDLILEEGDLLLLLSDQHHTKRLKTFFEAPSHDLM